MNGVRVQTQNDGTVPQNPQFSKGDRLRKARRVAGLQANELAELIGVSTNTISNAENDRGVTRRTLVAWAWATGVDAGWLEHGDRPAEPSAADRRQPGETLPGKGARRSPDRRSLSGWRLNGGRFVHPSLLGDSAQPCRLPAGPRRLPAVHSLSPDPTDLVLALSVAR